MDEQKESWILKSKTIKVSKVVETYRNPHSFQSEFVTLLDDIAKENNYSNSIELGCETGIVSMLIQNIEEKVFLDYNKNALNIAEKACKELGIKGIYLEKDMFDTKLEEGSYQLVFNSGVIEHYEYEERLNAVKEYARIMDENGTMVIAYPNHYSLPYRFAYVLGNYLFPKRFNWTTPPEKKIYDMGKEIKAANLVLKERKVIAKESTFDFLNFNRTIKNTFKELDKVFNFSGYLTVLIIKKRIK